MLVLTRRWGETICIGDSIRVTVHRLGEKNVQLSVHAPREVPIWREEIYQRTQREEAQAERLPAA